MRLFCHNLTDKFYTFVCIYIYIKLILVLWNVFFFLFYLNSMIWFKKHLLYLRNNMSIIQICLVNLASVVLVWEGKQEVIDRAREILLPW